MRQPPSLAGHLQAFFTDRLLAQRCASSHTVASYRDTFRLLLRFVEDQTGRAPASLSLTDLTEPIISSFLEYLEEERGNSPRSRNVRLAAIHSFFRYAAFREPGSAELIQRVLSIPAKRHRRTSLQYLTAPEVSALLAAPDLQTWVGRRDRLFFLVAVQTGLRVSELLRLRRQDVQLGVGAHVRCLGKGRKERCTPLHPETADLLDEWFLELPEGALCPVFPSSRGGHLSRDAIAVALDKYVQRAAHGCPGLARKRVTPHVLRHTAAMALLESGVDRAVISLWLGHERVETTQVYLHASLKMKEEALAKVPSSSQPPARYRPGDELLAFLEGL